MSARRQAALLDERTRRLAARPAAEVRREVRRLLTVAVGEDLYGLPLSETLRVAPLGSLGAAPSRHPAFIGLAVDGGVIRQAFDLAALLGDTTGAREAGGYQIGLRAWPAVTLRAGARPSVVDAEILTGPDAGRARVTTAGETEGRALALLALPDLLRDLSPLRLEPDA